MKGQFQHTMVEIDEAYAANGAWAQLRGGPMAVALLVWSCFLAVLALAGYIANSERFQVPYNWSVSPMALVILCLIAPAFVIAFALQWALGEHRTRKQTGIIVYGAEAAKEDGAARPLGRAGGAIGWVVFLSLAVVIFLALQRSKQSPLVPAPRAGGRVPSILATERLLDARRLETRALGLLVILPAVAGIAAILWAVRSVSRLQRLERGRTSLDPTTLHVSNRGICFVTSRHRVYQKWVAFEKFLEAEHFFLLYETTYTFRIVPKRAFASAEDLQRFVALLTEHVGHGLLLGQPKSGFPVITPS